MSTPMMVDERSCEHGMSQALCAGPGHYPADTDEHYTTSELMSATASHYHRQGLNCPWDCGSCPGNVDNDAYDGEGYDEPEPVYLVTTPLGTVTALTFEQAKAEARSAAALTGRACTVRKV